PLRELPPAVRGPRDPHRGQWQAAAHLLAVGHTVRAAAGNAWLRKILAATGYAGGPGPDRAKPIRHRSRAGDAERQAQTLPGRPAEAHRGIAANRASRWPAAAGARRWGTEKPKTKTFLRKENQWQFAGSPCLPLGGAGHQNTLGKEPPLPTPSSVLFRLILRCEYSA